jgi:hypothetical protein
MRRVALVAGLWAGCSPTPALTAADAQQFMDA